MQCRIVRPAALLFSTLALAGCLLDATIDAKGAGTVTIKYRLTTEAQLQTAKMRLKSPHVTLTSAQVDADKFATFEISFADVTKLSTTELFRTTTFSLVDDENGTRTLRVRFTNDNPSPLPEELVEYFGKTVNISVNLPGEVAKSNATVTEGKRVTWTYPLSDFTSMPEVNLSATFRVPTGKDVERGAKSGNAARQNEDNLATPVGGRGAHEPAPELTSSRAGRRELVITAASRTSMVRIRRIVRHKRQKRQEGRSESAGPPLDCTRLYCARRINSQV